MQKIRSNKTTISKIELLSEENKVNEIIGFGIRMFKGIDLNKLPKLYKRKLEEKLLLAKTNLETVLYMETIIYVYQKKVCYLRIRLQPTLYFNILGFPPCYMPYTKVF